MLPRWVKVLLYWTGIIALVLIALGLFRLLISSPKFGWASRCTDYYSARCDFIRDRSNP